MSTAPAKVTTIPSLPFDTGRAAVTVEGVRVGEVYRMTEQTVNSRLQPVVRHTWSADGFADFGTLKTRAAAVAHLLRMKGFA